MAVKHVLATGIGPSITVVTDMGVFSSSDHQKALVLAVTIGMVTEWIFEVILLAVTARLPLLQAWLPNLITDSDSFCGGVWICARILGHTSQHGR